MNSKLITDAITVLKSVIDTNANSSVSYVAQKTIEYTSQFQKGEISNAECTDLMADLKIDAIVAETADQISQKIAITKAFNDIMAVIGVIPLPTNL